MTPGFFITPPMEKWCLCPRYMVLTRDLELLQESRGIQESMAEVMMCYSQG